MTTITTDYGTIRIDQRISNHERPVSVSCTRDQAQAWARRPGAVWPCSALAASEFGVIAEFASNGDLVNLSAAPEDLSGRELTAWAEDVANAALDTPGLSGASVWALRDFRDSQTERQH